MASRTAPKTAKRKTGRIMISNTRIGREKAWARASRRQNAVISPTVSAWRRMAFRPGIKSRCKRGKAGQKRRVLCGPISMREPRKDESYRQFKGHIDRKVFHCLVKEVCQDMGMGLRVKAPALDVVQAVSEDYVVRMFRASQLNAKHGGRSTIMPKDFELAKVIMSIIRQDQPIEY